MRTIVEYQEPLSVVRLAPGTGFPRWADGLPMTSVTWSRRDTSVVCPTRSVPDRLPGTIEGPFAAFELQEPVDFGLCGVLAGLIVPLAEAQVPAFAISTFETDWVLVPGQLTRAARAAWVQAGFTVLTEEDM